MSLALDSSGSASGNLVTGESASVNTLNQLSDTYIFPLAGPFYMGGLVVEYVPATGTPRALTLHVDYEPVFRIKGVVPGNDICGAIRIINKSLNGSVTLTYHALGGSWTLLQSAILQAVSTTAISPGVAYFGLIPSPAILVPGTSANLILNSSTALALAQSLNPSGVSLTITPYELPEADQLSYLQQTGNSGSGNNSGGGMGSSNLAQESGGNLDAINAELGQLVAGQGAASAALGTAATATSAAATALGTSATALTAAATQLGNSSAAQGAITDPAWTGTGNGSAIAIDKGIFGKLVSILSALAGNLSVTGPSGAAIAQDTSVSAVNVSVQQLITAVKGTVSITGSTWVDLTTQPAHYYVRRETETQTGGVYTVTWENVDGTPATPTLANLSLAGSNSATGSNSVDQINLSYNATTNGTGYSTGDMLLHSYGLNTATSPATLSYSVWFNATTGAVLTSPPANGSYAQVGMSTVTVASTVLAPNAAQESGGNLAAISTAMGTVGDATWTGTGNASQNSLLKAIWSALKGVLNIRALASGTDSVTTVPSGTQTIAGAVTLSGAAQLAAGAAHIGAVAVDTALPAGTNAIGSVTVTALPALPAGANNIGTVTVNPLPTGTNAIGSVAVTALPALPAGTNALGSVAVTALPALPAGANTIGTVTVNPLPTGANTIGAVNINTLPALPTGANTIGAVTGPAGAPLALSSDILALTNAVKATVGISGTVWFDPTVNPPVYYVRRESINEGTGVETIAWFTPAGAAATPNASNLQAAGDAQNLQSISVNYTASAVGTGIALGDLVIHAYAIDRATSTPVIAYNIWLNATQGTILTTAPVMTNLTQSSASSVSVTSSALPTNAAQETGGHLAAIDAAQGTTADVAWTGTGIGTIVAILKAVWGRLNGVTYMLASDGTYVPFDSLSQTLVWTSGLLTSSYVSYNGHTYTQTLTYDVNNNVIGQSQLVMS